MTMTIDASDTGLANLLTRIKTTDEIIILNNGRPVARLLPIAPKASGSTIRFEQSDNDGMVPAFQVSEANDAMEQEITAFAAQHEQLIAHYLNNYVAFYQGKLVDHDEDQQALLARIDLRYPTETVLIRRVQSELSKIIHVRSPRLAKIP